MSCAVPDVRSARVHVLWRRPIGGDAPRESHRGAPGRARVLPRDPRGGCRALVRGGDPPLVHDERRRATRDASAAMAALDVDGTPLPPSTRPDGMYLCQRIGCDAVYAPTDEGNPEGCCRHHAGPPVFHDGTKSWSCCGAKSHDFGEFMSLPGCAVGRHTQKKPPKPAPSPNNVPATSAPVPVPVPVTTTNTAAAGTPADADAATPRRGARGAARDSSAATTPRARRHRRRTFPRRRPNARPRRRRVPWIPTPRRSVATRVAGSDSPRRRIATTRARITRDRPSFTSGRRDGAAAIRYATISTSSCGYRRVPGGGTTRTRAGGVAKYAKRAQKDADGLGGRGRWGGRAVRTVWPERAGRASSVGSAR